MPWTYRHPEIEWRGFLDDIREVLGTPSPNVAYTAAEGVLTAFRGRLTPTQVLAFSDALPSVIRSLFIQGWRLEPARPWASRATYLSEMTSLRRNHNLVGDRGIEAVSYALHRALGADRLRKALAEIGPDAEAFWELKGYSEEELAYRFR